MKILLQSNIWDEYEYDRFCTSLVDEGIDCSFADVIPFTDNFVQEIDFVPSYVFGSGRFVNICRAKGFPTFPSFAPIELDLIPSHHWINGDGYKCKWKNLIIDSPKFIKPFTEKFFTGVLVESRDDLQKIQLATSFIEDEGDEDIWVAPPKHIKTEVRFFVLYGEIITASFYKMNGIGHHLQIDHYHPAWAACDRILKDWKRQGCNANVCSPDIDGFVIDLGLCDDTWKVVELNNLNSSGIYKCDTDAIARVLKLFGK